MTLFLEKFINSAKLIKINLFNHKKWRILGHFYGLFESVLVTVQNPKPQDMPAKLTFANFERSELLFSGVLKSFIFAEIRKSPKARKVPQRISKILPT